MQADKASGAAMAASASVDLRLVHPGQMSGKGDILYARRHLTPGDAIPAEPAVATPSSAAGSVRASAEIRLEPTAMPTWVFRLGSSTLGWHPVVTPVLARVAA